MSGIGRNSLLLLVISVLIVGSSVAALAAEEGGEGGDGAADSTTTTIDSGLSPAVPVENEEAAEEQAEWTYRYIIPTGLALAAIIVLFTAIKYFTDVVRKRYRIIEE